MINKLKELESQITRLLDDFEKETGLVTSQIKLKFGHIYVNNIPLREVKVVAILAEKGYTYGSSYDKNNSVGGVSS